MKKRYMIKEFYKTLLLSDNSNLNPIEKHILNNFIYRNDGHFNIHYREWIMRRINKILSIYDIEFFKDKKILVLGDGTGTIGSFFASLGADVLALEYQQSNINFAKLRFGNIKNYKIQKFNLNNDFTKFGRFDIIINWGFIEEIYNVDNVLKCCAKMSDLIFVETVVADNIKEAFIGESDTITKVNSSDVGLINEKYMRVSEKYIEDAFKKKGFKWKKYNDEDLNATINNYTWENKNDNVSYIPKPKNCWTLKRRFWIFEKNKKNEQ